MSQLWPSTKREYEPLSITLASIQNLLQSYLSYVPPELRALDTLRYQEIPNRVVQRREAGDAFLEKSEVSALVDWKLKHGTYRPKLAILVALNSDDDVLSVTRSAFAGYEVDKDAYIGAITTLTKLKGIGPATASLLLSCYDPVHIPFFSDQLYRYALWVRARGQGWDRKIKYNLSEYRQMFDQVAYLRERLERENGASVSALELEKAAYVLGKEVEPSAKRNTADENADDGNLGNVIQSPRPGKKRKSAETKDESTKKTPKEGSSVKRMKKAPSTKPSPSQTTKVRLPTTRRRKQAPPNSNPTSKKT